MHYVPRTKKKKYKYGLQRGKYTVLFCKDPSLVLHGSAFGNDEESGNSNKPVG